MKIHKKFREISIIYISFFETTVLKHNKKPKRLENSQLSKAANELRCFKK